jgi:DNA-binding NarL/FixJ family response regulator
MIGEAQDCSMGVALVGKPMPDVVTVGAGTPNLNRMEATRRIRSVFTQAKVIALSGYPDTLHVAVNAIEANRRRIKQKLNAHNPAELVKMAILGGVTSLEP